MEASINQLLNKYTGLNRFPNPFYPTNLAILILSTLATTGAAVIRMLGGEPFIDASLWGIGAGFAVFFSWAICRELDPDHELSAFIGAALALLGFSVYGLPNNLGALLIMVLLRVVSRTTGFSIKFADFLVLGTLAGWLTYDRSWIFGALAVLAFLANSQIAPSHSRSLLYAGLMGALTILLGFLTESPGAQGDLSIQILLWLAVLLGIFLFLVFTSNNLRSLDDRGEEPLNPRRVQASLALALIGGVIVALWSGRAGLITLMPLWDAALGAALFRIFVLLRAGR